MVTGPNTCDSAPSKTIGANLTKSHILSHRDAKCTDWHHAIFYSCGLNHVIQSKRIVWVYSKKPDKINILDLPGGNCAKILALWSTAVAIISTTFTP